LLFDKWRKNRSHPSAYIIGYNNIYLQLLPLHTMAKDIDIIEKKILGFKARKLNLFTTSSFQTHSIVLLHIISRIDNTIPVYFINTGYLFPKTIEYKDQISDFFGLKIIDLVPTIPKHLQKDTEGNLLFSSNPDLCCHINKVLPLDNLLPKFDIWINGVRADQTAIRSAMKEEENAPHGVIRYHPMLSWTKQEIYKYIKEFDLPRHPLDPLGYSSIGCEPCTRKPDLNFPDRNGRWFGQNKTECGLNTELVINHEK
jgi:3''-phosphoadenosine 5''-phosphosulfate sulfotransferase (PAPS reductase)/FAD synthetase and related enzymes